MPTRSSQDASAATIRDLGLPARAVAALARAGVDGLDDLARLTRRDLARISGLGPGMIAAIRAAVPEPPGTFPTAAGRSSAAAPPRRDDGAGRRAGERAGDAADGAPSSPAIPSFASLRAPRRPTAVDLLVPGTPWAPGPPEPPAAPGPDAPPRAVPSSPSGPGAPSGGPRPAEYGDLLRLGARAAVAVARLPVRLAGWSLGGPARCVRRLLGG